MIYKLIVVLDFGVYVYKFIIYKIMNEVRGKICVCYILVYVWMCMYLYVKYVDWDVYYFE